MYNCLDLSRVNNLFIEYLNPLGYYACTAYWVYCFTSDLKRIEMTVNELMEPKTNENYHK